MQVIYAYKRRDGLTVTVSYNNPQWGVDTAELPVSITTLAFYQLFGFVPKLSRVYRVETVAFELETDSGPGNAADAGGLRGADPGATPERPQPDPAPRHGPKRHDDSYPAAGAEQHQPGRERERQARAATTDLITPLVVTVDREFLKLLASHPRIEVEIR